MNPFQVFLKSKINQERHKLFLDNSFGETQFLPISLKNQQSVVVRTPQENASCKIHCCKSNVRSNGRRTSTDQIPNQLPGTKCTRSVRAAENWAYAKMRIRAWLCNEWYDFYGMG
jgi:hypothetical protein